MKQAPSPAKGSKPGLLRAVDALDVAAVRAMLRQRPELARMLDEGDRTLLHRACSVNARERGLPPGRALAMVKMLIGQGLDPDAGLMADGFRVNPVFFAAARGRNRAVVELLVRLGARAQGLFAAAWYEDLPMVALLLRLGAELDEETEDETPFLHAWKNRRFKAAARLRRAGADVDYQDSKKLTALHYAIERDYEPARVRWLVRQGASPDLADAHGVTAREKASPKRDPAYRAALGRPRRYAEPSPHPR